MVILLLGTCIYIAFFGPEKPIVKEIPKEEAVDDRISPLTNQGLILEIKRIRHRGLLDLLIKPGTSWKRKPEFYFISIIDDLEYVSKDVVAFGAASETLFDTWDTMFQEGKVMKNVEEEQETSEVTIIIMERVKKGLFDVRSSDIIREKIHVTYDYRTGRWHGDDCFKDYDGYGHYVGGILKYGLTCIKATMMVMVYLTGQR